MGALPFIVRIKNFQLVSGYHDNWINTVSQRTTGKKKKKNYSKNYQPNSSFLSLNYLITSTDKVVRANRE